MKLQHISFAMLIIAAVMFTSCKEEKKETPSNNQVETTEDSKSTADLNPAHGLPGHRCDLPVGAPLGEAGKTKIQPTNTTNSNVSPVWANPPSPTKNPPHGEPGHDCSKPVGSDL